MFSDNSLYEVSFPNGQTEELIEDLIAENMLSWVDSEGHHYQVLKDISYHYADWSVSKRSNGFIRICNRNIHPKKTTRG